MSFARRLESISPWLAGASEPAPSLVGDHETDVAIVGAGLTGLSSALALRREGLRVAVLEAQTAGFGASGRNAGHLTPTIGKDLPTLTRMYGRERVSGLIRLAEEAISHVEKLIAEHVIECDYEPVGNVIAAVDERQHANIDRVAEAAKAFGIPGELLDGDAMRRRGLPRAFTRGYLEPHGGVLDPGRYVAGLRRAAEAAGAELYDRSPAVAVDDDSPARVRTPAGSVRARHVVIATNAYTPELGLLRSSGIRLHVQLFRTEPLTDAELARIGWAGREGIYTAHEMLESYRLTADNCIVGGAKNVRYAYGGHSLPDVEESLRERLARVFKERFPEIDGVAIAKHWGGPIFMSLDFLPVVGRMGRHGNIAYSIGYAGHGVAQASYAGEMIADLLLGRDGLGAALWSRRRLPTPPEPLRWLAFKALTALFGRIDRRSDDAARRRDRHLGG